MCVGSFSYCIFIKVFTFMYKRLIVLIIQGEELRKQIGAAAYIECSSKTQQVELGLTYGVFSCPIFLKAIRASKNC